MGSLNSTVMAETGERPDALDVSQRAQNMKIHQAADSKTGVKSYAAQSAEQAQETKKIFVSECISRGTLFASPKSEALYADQELFQRVCSEYIVFCYNNNITMTMSTLAMWLGVHVETLQRILRNRDFDERYATLKSMAEIMNYSMEQELATYEGNTTGRIYLTKARLGWQEAAQQVDINIGLQQQSYQPETLPQALNLIDITPELE